jgi:hypothetical protein
MPTDTGLLGGIEMIPRTDVAMLVFEPGREIDINVLHSILGHVNEVVILKTAEYYNIKVCGDFKPCYVCSLSNIRQKPVCKNSESRSEKPGERLYMDIRSIASISFGGSKFWLLVVDDYSDYYWSLFLQRKSQLAERAFALIMKIKVESEDKINVQKIVQRLRCDNAGENLNLQKLFEKEGYKIKFELTPPGNPQYNGKVERKFAILYARVRAMMNDAGFNNTLRRGLWAEAAKAATDIEKLLLVTKTREKSATEKFIGVKSAICFNAEIW